MDLEAIDFLESALDHLARLMSARVEELGRESLPQPLAELTQEWPLARLGRLFDLSTEPDVRPLLAVLLALAPDLNPHLLDEAVFAGLKTVGEHPRIGGVRGRESRVFLPTAETFVFLCGPCTIADRFAALRVLEPSGRRPLFRLDPAPAGEPWTSARLIAGPALLERVTDVRRARAGAADFPAERIETTLDWKDLVLDEATVERVRELEAWVRHQPALDALDKARRLPMGHRALFFGPPGTGKSVTASLLGKHTGRDVYRIDLSLVVSRFIGETEKNLSRIFAQAEHQSWILFFDEADALFGKRTQVRDAHDRYANQEVSYLLQRVEAFEGLVILATNFRSNIDEAFQRRFQSFVHFPRPTVPQRELLWEKLLPKGMTMAPSVNLAALCRQHELTGANIANVIQFACLQALRREEKTLSLQDLETAIQREYQKEGKVG